MPYLNKVCRMRALTTSGIVSLSQLTAVLSIVFFLHQPSNNTIFRNYAQQTNDKDSVKCIQ
jgi:hypothetical protein